MTRNPERRAWFILLAAFGVFCLILITCPASLYFYVISAAKSMPVELTSVRGIVLMSNGEAELSASITDGNSVELGEGRTVTTDATSQAILNFADDSSLTLYGDTQVTLRRSQQPRFGRLGSYPAEITVEVHRGRIRATAARNRTDLMFKIYTPHAEIELDQGSFSVESNEALTQATTRLGEAAVRSDEVFINLRQGERTVVGPGFPLSDPLPAEQNLLADSNFTAPLGEFWEPYNINPIASVTPSTEVTVDGDRRVLNFRSQGADETHSEIGVVQYVNKDVRDFQSLRIFAEVRLLNQSLPGGGQQGSEFPITINIAYQDAAGTERNWFHHFYYEPPRDNNILPDVFNQPDNASERVAPDVWVPYESVNLVTTLGPAKPVFIRSVKIYASGWLYDSMITNVSLLAEE